MSNHIPMRLIPIFMLAFFFINEANCVKVNIENRLPEGSPPLKVWCESHDDNLGTHTLTYGQRFDFSFGESIFKKTKFWCTFYWKDKKKVVDVFYSGWNKGDKCKPVDCNWTAWDDGIYYSGQGTVPKGATTKKYDW